MTNIFQIIFLMALAFSCAKSNSLSDNNKVKFNLFSSSYDPCLVPNKCQNRKIIPPMIALGLFENGRYKSAPQLGDQEMRRIEKTQNTTKMVGDEFEEIGCALAFDQVRTLVDIDSSSIFVKEEKSNFLVKPAFKECQDLLKDKENLPLIIAIENRDDISTEGPLGIDRESLSKLKMETLKIDSSSLLRISGVIKTKSAGEDFNGNPMTFNIETSVLIMQDLTQSFFSSERFNHTISRIEINGNKMIPSENVQLLSNLKFGIDVSDFDINDFNRNQISDRRDEE